MREGVKGKIISECSSDARKSYSRIISHRRRKYFSIKQNIMLGKTGTAGRVMPKSKIVMRNLLSTIFPIRKQMMLVYCTLSPLADGVFCLTCKNI